MSDLLEIRREIAAIRDTTTKTAQDVAWIKKGMEDDRERVDKHDEQIRSIERRQWTLSGISAAIGALLGIGGSHGLKL